MAVMQQTARRTDLDRLRLLACLSTFVYHAIQVFDLNPYYHLKSVTASPALDVAARLLHAVRMPLFFLIAGMVGFAALARLSDREVIVRRAWRLLPPFLFGIILLTPIIKYFEVLDGRSISWRGITALDGPPPDPLLLLRLYFTRLRWFSWSHMWFPLYLLLFGALLLPVMRAMARTDASARRLSPATVLSLPLLVLVVVELVLRPVFPWHIPNLFWDWASVSVYLTCMTAGAAFIRNPQIEIVLQRWVLAFTALAGCGAALYLGTDVGPWRSIGRAVWLWGLLCTAIGLGPWLARGRIAGERALSDGALPIYVLHHVPLIVIAYAVKDLPWPIWQRYGVIVLGAFAVTLLLYLALVRPFNIMRSVFGMPPRAQRSN